MSAFPLRDAWCTRQPSRINHQMLPRAQRTCGEHPVQVQAHDEMAAPQTRL